MRVKEAMNRPFVVEKDISLMEVAKIMSSKNIGSLIFTKNDDVKGIITEADLVKHFGSKERISQVMKKSPISVSPDILLDDALKIMQKNKIHKLVVMQDNKLVGIITLTDIMAHAEELEEEFLFDN